MSGLPAARRLSSARLRRRLAWSALTALTAGAIASAVALLPERGEPPAGRATSGAPAAVYRPPAPVSYGRREREAAARTILGFVQSAVIRRHLAYSYGLVTPALRRGFSRSTWALGAIPVVPFPAGTDLRGAVLVRSIRGELDYKVSLFPPKQSGISPALYDLTLKRVGRRWLVDSWAPSFRGMFGPTSAVASPVGQGVLKPTGPQIRRGWIYVLIGSVALALFLGPLVLGGRWLVERRRLRALL